MDDMLKIYVLKEDTHPKTGQVWIRPGMVGTVGQKIALRLITEGKARLWKEGDYDPQAPVEEEKPEVLHVHHHHHVVENEEANNQLNNKEDNNGNSNG